VQFDHIGVPMPAKRHGMRLLDFIEVDDASVEFVQPY